MRPLPLRLLPALATLFIVAPELVATNRLAHERSLYLQQHATNPVDWYPWGEEAFARARAENKPIFLSIGYSTCHWCHVMERESFANPEIAALLNQHFIAIKVDREERPDIDRVYMTFVQASTGSGGWPLSVWLTPDRKPFFGGTYFPPGLDGRRGGFKSTLTTLADAWRKRHAEIALQADTMLMTLAEGVHTTHAEERAAFMSLREAGFQAAVARFDPEHGGFGAAPKFPQPALVAFLLDLAARSPDAATRSRSTTMALHTLRSMSVGGIHDWIGGGFHRYATDDAWRLPHFEKMLYDQAQLADVYLAASRAHGADAELAATARDTLDFIVENMSLPGGGFFSAVDAESTLGDGGAHEEGAFYLWTLDEIAAAVTPDALPVLTFACDLSTEGNTGSAELRGKNVLTRARSIAQTAAHFDRTLEEISSILTDSRARLFVARARRPAPAHDDTVLTAWNALAISALARAATVWDEPKYHVAAARAAAFLRDQLYDPRTGELARSHRGGRNGGAAVCEDYAFLVQALLDLYESDFDPQWLTWAERLQEKQDALFEDAAHGGYFASAERDASVVLRLKPDLDDAEPSPNSVALRNLARLAALLHRDDLQARAQRVADAFSSTLARDPLSMPQMLASLSWLDRSPQQVLIHGPADSAGCAELVRTVRSHGGGPRVLLRIDERSREFFGARLDVVAGLPDDPAIPTAYVCENFTCQMPTRDPRELARQLDAALTATSRR